MNTKIIFLDFDGVITTSKSKWQIDQNKVNLITKICKETGAIIVVSSSWGVGKSTQDLRNITSFDKEFSNLIVGNIEHKYPLRGENIQEYIDNNINRITIKFINEKIIINGFDKGTLSFKAHDNVIFTGAVNIDNEDGTWDLVECTVSDKEITILSNESGKYADKYATVSYAYVP